MWTSFLDQVIYPSIWSLLGLFAINVTRHAAAWFHNHNKELLHFRGASVCVDAFAEALGEMGTEVTKRLPDGITPQERTELEAQFMHIAKNKLMRLAGFYKSDLDSWIREQFRVRLGKYLIQTPPTSLSENPLKPEPSGR